MTNTSASIYPLCFPTSPGPAESEQARERESARRVQKAMFSGGGGRGDGGGRSDRNSHGGGEERASGHGQRALGGEEAQQSSQDESGEVLTAFNSRQLQRASSSVSLLRCELFRTVSPFACAGCISVSALSLPITHSGHTLQVQL